VFAEEAGAVLTSVSFVFVSGHGHCTWRKVVSPLCPHVRVDETDSSRIQQIRIPRYHWLWGDSQLCACYTAFGRMAIHQVGTGKRMGSIRRYLASRWCQGHLDSPLDLLCLRCHRLRDWVFGYHRGPSFSSLQTTPSVHSVVFLQRKPSLVRFYRDYSIADFSFCTFVTAITTYAVFHTSARAAICEELSHHPELMRDTADLGLNLENCERWLERAALGFVALMFIITVVRASLVPCIPLYPH